MPPYHPNELQPGQEQRIREHAISALFVAVPGLSRFYGLQSTPGQMPMPQCRQENKNERSGGTYIIVVDGIAKYRRTRNDDFLGQDRSSATSFQRKVGLSPLHLSA
jgi:hypothetical protein